MKIENLSKICSHGATFKEEMIDVSTSVALRVITFNPPERSENPSVVFVAGWISHIQSWKEVLKELTSDFKVYYVETREKISSRVRGKSEFSIYTLGRDIVELVSILKLKEKKYILFGSSLGATVILDCYNSLKKKPLCIVLVAPNAEFRMPGFGKVMVTLMPSFLYRIIKPFVKWYLKTFRMDVKSDYQQYEKYCRALDAADPKKLKKASLSLSKYTVWDVLKEIETPLLIIGASKDKLHEPENIRKMTSMIKNCKYIDMETNKNTHSRELVKIMRDYLSDLTRPKKSK